MEIRDLEFELENLLPNSFWETGFLYGSHLYGTQESQSDYDLIVVTSADKQTVSEDIENSRRSGTFFDIHCISVSEFEQRLSEHDIVMIEGISLLKHIQGQQYYFGDEYGLEIDLPMLRRSISSKCSNSFVKAKKKIIVEEDRDLRVSMKSLFHSIRMYEFGRQIAEYGYVKNFTSCANLYREIVEDYKDRTDEELLCLIKEKYQPIYNKYASEFKQVCPK